MEQQKDIRTDLWPTMSMQQLGQQQELILNKLSLLTDIANSVPAAKPLYLALQTALTELNKLIDSKRV